MKATEQFFPVVLFIVLHKVVLTFEVLWAKSISVTIQMKAAELSFSCGVVYYALQGGFYITSMHIGGH